MLHLIEAAVRSHKARRHLVIANQAIRVAQEHRHSPVGDYAESLAAQELKRALRADAAGHAGRVGHAVGISRC